MTPQVQQVFVSPLAGPLAGAAGVPDAAAGDGQAEAALTGNLQECDFARRMQDDGTDADMADTPLAPPMPLPTDLGSQVAAVAMRVFCPSVSADPEPDTIAQPVAITLRDHRHDIADAAAEARLTRPVLAVPIDPPGVEVGPPPTPIVPEPAAVLPQLASVKPITAPVLPAGTNPARRDVTANFTPIRRAETPVPVPLEPPSSPVPPPPLQAGPDVLANPVSVAPPPLPLQAGILPSANPASGAPPAVSMPLLAGPPVLATPIAVAPLPLTAPSKDLKKHREPALDLAGPVMGLAPAATAEPWSEPAPATPAETVFRLRLGAGIAANQQAAPTAPPQPADFINLTPAPQLFATTAPLASAIRSGDAAESASQERPVTDETITPPPTGNSDTALTVPEVRNAETALPAPFTAIAEPVKLPSSPLPQPNGAAEAMQPDPIALPPRLGADLIALTKSPPHGPVEILLNPEELGHLRFEIHQKADQLRVVLSVERPETMDLLRRNADHLLGEFRAAGFPGASLSFGQWDHQNSNPRAAPDPHPPPPPPQDWDFDPPPPPPPLRRQSPEIAASTGLNIRL